MNANTQEQLQRLYRGMTAEQIDAHEDWVRRFKAERAEAEAKRAAFLRTASDVDAVKHALFEGAPGAEEYEPEDALKVLALAGFVRNGDDPSQPFTHTQAEVDNICRLSDEIVRNRVEEFTEPGGYLEAAYRAGFKEAGEGWNGEHTPEAVDDERFIESMRADLSNMMAA
jgi:hypothetical protein